MKKNVVVIGGSGDVGRGIVRVLLEQGHRVVAAARHAGGLAALSEALGHPVRLRTVTGSLASDDAAAAMLQAVLGVFAEIDAVIVSVNAPRQPARLLTHSTDDLAALIRGDLITHYAAARTFISALQPQGVYIGIGGGSCDFILEGGVPQSVAQAGLRMLYRGLAHEFAEKPVELRQLIIASIVNGASTRDRADPQWVTDTEIGEQVAAIVDNPRTFPGPILRIARRDNSGRPVFSAETPTRVQGFR
jgi:NAD(P)-dependent dehydrogenase (short-subunit alcohol dehydrogenase family)